MVKRKDIIIGAPHRDAIYNISSTTILNIIIWPTYYIEFNHLVPAMLDQKLEKLA